MREHLPSVGGVLVDRVKAGDVEQIDAVAEYAEEVRIDTAQYAESVRGADARLLGLDSRAIARLSAKLSDRLLPGATTLEQSARTAKQAFGVYASAVDGIHAEADRLASEVERRLVSLGAAMTTIARISEEILAPHGYQWHSAPSPAMPEPRLREAQLPASAEGIAAAQRVLRDAHETVWRNTALGWRDDLDAIARARARWDTLILERKAAEQRLVRALEETAVGQFAILGAGLAGGRKRAIALGFAGELWGIPDVHRPPSTAHPLLAKLIGRSDGGDVWDNPGDTAAIAANWALLTEAEQETLIAAVPGVIGNLPGLPYWARDRANRNQLEFFRQHPQLLSPEQLRLLAGLQRIVEREAGQMVPDPPIQLVALELSGAVPNVAVGYGDLDAATHTTWAVPGMNNDAADGLAGMDKSSLNLYRAQRDLTRFSGQNTVVAWLGYDTPGVPPADWGVIGSAYALAAAPRLAMELDGQFAARAAGPHGVPVTNVLAHSYGTTVATIALTAVTHPVDALVMLGSAGLDTERVETLDALNVRELTPGQRAIYTAHASGDRLAPAGAGLAGRGQPNPNATALGELQTFSPVYSGALSFSAEGDPAEGLLPTDGHSLIGEGREVGFQGMSASGGRGYLDPKTQSLKTTAKITTGLVDERLAASFTRTEARRVELVVDAQSGSVLPRRVGVPAKSGG